MSSISHDFGVVSKRRKKKEEGRRKKEEGDFGNRSPSWFNLLDFAVLLF
jgi:hypothetical protein